MIMPEGENKLVRWLQKRFATDAARVEIGIGDDMAAVRFDGPLVAVTTDMLLDGVHFDTTKHEFAAIGRKAVACSLSDCAGMACEPRFAAVSVALNNNMSLADVQRLYEGMAAVADEFGCAIIGGDTTSWMHPLAIDVAMLAEPMSQRGPVKRSTAKPGNTIYITGPLGGSIFDRHLTFSPRLDIARELANDTRLHAMMDISDGLALDLNRLCEASNCVAELSAEALQKNISPAAIECAQSDGRTALDHAMSDGEDFELLITGDQLEHPQLIAIGRIIEPSEPGRSHVIMRDKQGGTMAIEPKGFEHFT
jgi:thiamine-monophosphate kinase